MEVTEEAIQPVWRLYGVLGLVRLPIDIALRMAAEYAAEFWADIRYGLRMMRGSPRGSWRWRRSR